MNPTSLQAPPSAVQRDVALAPFTTLGVGGPARFFVEAVDDDLLGDALGWARGAGLATLVIGGGSNVLVDDAGFDGLVVRTARTGVDVRMGGEGAIELDVAAGEVWDDLVARTVAEGWGGIECLTGIPGAVGAAPIQNIGAYGQDAAEVVIAVDTLDRLTGARRRFAASECGFGYRTSRFKRDASKRSVVVGVTLRLAVGAEGAVKYRQLADAVGAARDLATVSATVRALRKSKSMVLDATDENRRSAGSFFLNPVVPAHEADTVATRVAGAGHDPASMPRYPQPDGTHKLSAAWLIERAGMPRGYGDGPVGLSTRHTLAVVNRGHAKASDIVAFAGHVCQRVQARFGVALVPEPVFIGFDRPVTALLDAAVSG